MKAVLSRSMAVAVPAALALWVLATGAQAQQSPVHLASLAADKPAVPAEFHGITAPDEGVVGDMAQIATLLNQGKVDRALKAIDELQKKRPADVVPVVLRGRALLQKGDRAGARQALEQALQMDANYFPAIAMLAGLDNAEKRPDAARARLEGAIERQPANVLAYRALAELRAAQGAGKTELIGLLRRAVDAAPRNPMAHQLLAEFFLRVGDPKEALAVAQKANTALPDSPPLLDALGRAQSATGDYGQAQASFARMAELLPKSPLPYLRMASAHLLAGDRVAAEQNLHKALELDPRSLEAQQGLASLAMATQQPAQALTISRNIQKQRPKEQVGYVLEGQIHAAANDWDKAIQAYRTGLKQTDSPALAIRLHDVMMAAGKTKEAEQWATQWERSHAKDAAFPLYLGNRSMSTKDLPASLVQFDRVLALQPDNAVVLNNRAWVKGQLGREDALADAERANALAPNQPAFMDTWAMLLSGARQHDKAVEIQKKVVQLQPQVLVYKLNLAKVYINAGQKEAAKPLLDELAQAGEGFPAHAEVEQLRKGL